ncbi:MAG: exodeoxyribonuclease VII small subunit [Firmicutes bacterium]|nr:exodeoxyribonuclease VII small subunit [Bacillota bacterium]
MNPTEKPAEFDMPENFERALARLEEILRVLEKGELGLEESISRFREGSALYKYCQEKLKSAEGEIRLLVENLDGTVETKPFEESRT